MTLVALGWATALVAGAKAVHRHLGLLRRLYIPSSVLAGVVALLIGPQVLGALSTRLGGPEAIANGVLPASVIEVWESLPGLLINVVFAALFLGKTIPAPREIVRLAGPQVALGQTLAWGQYVVGIELALLVLGPVFGMDPMAGALIEIGLEGGHGTAAALSETFEEFGFSEGADLALGLATIGLVGGVLSGIAIINWAARSGRLDLEADPGRDDDRTDRMCEFDEREADAAAAAEEDADPLSAHLGLIALAIALGWMLQQGLIAVESVTWARDGGLELMRHLPLFPLAMIGGLLLQLALDRIGDAGPHVDRSLMNRISGASLDIIIVAAIGTLSLTVLGDNIGPLLLMAGAGVAWSIGAFLLLAPRMVRDYPYQRGLADFGQSTRMTVTGLPLVRMADPANRANAMESFGYKQLLFEPFVGGGLFTALSVPLIAQLGPWPVLGITSVLLAAFLALGLLYFGRQPGGPNGRSR
ncbi:MAG: sodium/glutamate symporter [Anaerosomatales bacterium]|nr:sodium/glutamate symporter [Anaerosomatales bacterium]